ncbi:MAG TPA: type 1 glutamine amidotransferase domain-containing protein [Spirochaetota bacterium]|nr:type 1 glutamine amidotransferase domain-containing protein [Spirochaetota bacterium]
MKKIITSIIAFIITSILTTIEINAGYKENSARLLKASNENSIPEINTTDILNNNKELKDLASDNKISTELKGKKIAVISTDGVEELEIIIPIIYLKNRGAIVEVIAPEASEFPPNFGVKIPSIRKTHILTVNYMRNSGWLKIDKFTDNVSASDYDAVIIPGGGWNPDALRTDAKTISFLKEMDRQRKPIAAICHGPLVLINAGIIKNRKATSFWSVQIDLQNAGAIVSDKNVVIDKNLITSRFPFDLPVFLKALETELKKNK